MAHRFVVWNIRGALATVSPTRAAAPTLDPEGRRGQFPGGESALGYFARSPRSAVGDGRLWFARLSTCGRHRGPVRTRIATRHRPMTPLET